MSKDNFEQYVISEFKVDNQAAVEIKYTHNISIKKAVINHMITMNLKFYDKNVKLLKTCALKFVNNVLAPSYAKKLININPGELNNKFMSAKEDIIKVIHAEYEEKMNEIVEKMKGLQPGTCVVFGSAFKLPTIVKMEMPYPQPMSQNVDVSRLWY